ncbi:hypothetical protein PTTG_02860 [Puccinia triticina 1-1 BBBD Race 1]|uniref:CCHC-type domain-containing protein n=1 Tax=Puccinia triticina (isolate 1-1 / race 1 (BBBD)) TaxID=630390 RepID=A0A180GP19_PUCT1|nr:hypothetical protein PTTG_02860 [Puccinia triticina 1-1 BBBD Race 1]
MRPIAQPACDTFFISCSISNSTIFELELELDPAQSISLAQSPSINRNNACSINSEPLSAHLKRSGSQWQLGLLRPETDYKDVKPLTQGSQRLYYAEESGSDWDTLSDMARATLKMMLLINLAIRYKETKPPIATWIAWICNTASDLKSVKLTPADQQICDRLLRGLDDSWKPIRDHLVYSPNEISLDNAIGALEAHKVSMQVSFNQTPETFASLMVTRKKKPGCWNCGQVGHHSLAFPNPPAKNKSKARFKTRAGAVSVARLGDGGPSGDEEEQEEEDNFDPEIDVVWG